MRGLAVLTGLIAAGFALAGSYALVIAYTRDTSSITDVAQGITHYFDALVLFPASAAFGILAVLCEQIHDHTHTTRWVFDGSVPPVTHGPPPAPTPPR